MIEIIETKSSDLMQIKIIDEATSADISQIKPVLKKHAVESTDPRLMFIFAGLSEWNKVVKIWTDLNMNSEQVNDFTRIAVVGSESWKGWLSTAIESMVDTDLKFFSDIEIEHARKWVEK